MSYVSLLLLPERYTQRVFSIYFLYMPACEPFDVPSAHVISIIPFTRWFASLFSFSRFANFNLIFSKLKFPESWTHSKSKGAVPERGCWVAIFSRSQTISFSNKSFSSFVFVSFHHSRNSHLCRCLLREIKLNGIYIKKILLRGRWEILEKRCPACVVWCLRKRCKASFLAQNEIRSSIRQLLPTANLLFLFKEVESSSPLLKTVSCAVSIKAKNPSARNCPEEWRRRRFSKSRLLLLL